MIIIQHIELIAYWCIGSKPYLYSNFIKLAEFYKIWKSQYAKQLNNYGKWFIKCFKDMGIYF